MYQIQNFTSDAKQRLVVQLADGTSFLLRMSYSDVQQAWFIYELTYGTLTINGMRLVCAQNLLRQYKNQLPFGLYVTTLSHRDNLLVTDLQQGNTLVYVLTAAEVAAYEAYIGGH